MNGSLAKRNVALLSVMHVLIASAALVVSSSVLFWESCGLGMKNIAILQTWFALALIVFEVPTGYLADVLNRRGVIVLGVFFFSLGFLVYGLGSSFEEFLAAELLIAFGLSLSNGADQALLCDSFLEDLECEEERKKAVDESSRAWGKMLSFALWAAAGYCVVGGLMASHNLRLPYYWAAGLSGLAVPLAFCLREPKRKRIKAEHGHVREAFRIMRMCFVENRRLGWLLMVSALVSGMLGSLVWFYQPYMVLSGLGVGAIGAVFAMFQGVAGISSHHSSKLNGRLSESQVALVLFGLLGLSCLLMSGVVVWWGFALIFAHQLVRGAMEPLYTRSINREVGSEIRATTHSLRSMGGRFFQSILMLPAGFAADHFGVLTALGGLGTAFLVFGLAALALKPKVREAQ